MEDLRFVLEEVAQRISRGKEKGLHFMMMLATGKFTENPFSPAELGKVRAIVGKFFRIEDTEMQIAQGQSLRLEMLDDDENQNHAVALHQGYVDLKG